MERHEVLGIRVSAINMEIAFQEIQRWIEAGERRYVCITGVHGVMESQRDPELRRIHNEAGMVTPDGMPLVWIMKSAGLKHVDRVYGPDLMAEVLRRGRSHNYRHFFYGSSEATLKQLNETILSRWPGAQIAGMLSPPFRSLTAEEDISFIDRINASHADIVWVGLSTPKQERWMAAHRDHLSASVLIGVGAAFDLCAGVVRQAPRLIQRSGLEWAFRTVMEPKRLWRRYFTNNPRFVLLLARERLLRATIGN